MREVSFFINDKNKNDFHNNCFSYFIIAFVLFLQNCFFHHNKFEYTNNSDGVVRFNYSWRY